MSTTRVDLYREAMDLEEKRASLQREIELLSSRLSQIQSQLFSGEITSAPATVATVKEQSPAQTTRRKKGRAGRGELKAQIFDALKAAGANGVRVMELSSSLGIKPVNIYAWFQSSAKRHPQIKKIGKAHYRLA